MPLLGAAQYVTFLEKLPYTLSSSYAGYALWICLAALCVYVWIRYAGERTRMAWVTLTFVLSIVAISPVIYPGIFVHSNNPTPGIGLFFSPTRSLLCLVVYWRHGILPRASKAALAIVALVFLIAGMVENTKHCGPRNDAFGRGRGKVLSLQPGGKMFC